MVTLISSSLSWSSYILIGRISEPSGRLDKSKLIALFYSMKGAEFTAFLDIHTELPTGLKLSSEQAVHSS